ncbi:MAG: 50S ribosomal protein L30 [Candidatus Gallimonas sp.]
MVKVTLVKSTIGEVESVKATVAALGLTKIRTTKTFEDTPALRGQIRKVAHLVKVENV